MVARARERFRVLTYSAQSPTLLTLTSEEEEAGVSERKRTTGESVGSTCKKATGEQCSRLDSPTSRLRAVAV